MAVVGEVTTPTLVIHSELDFRCPLEQATRYYAALKRRGRMQSCWSSRARITS